MLLGLFPYFNFFIVSHLYQELTLSTIVFAFIYVGSLMVQFSGSGKW